MVKIFKVLLLIMTLGLIMPSSIIAEELFDKEFSSADSEDFDLKNLEEELRRILENEDQSTPHMEQPIVSEEKETIIIPSEGQEVKKLEISYNEPLSTTLKKELNAQPQDEKEEVIILDEIEDEDLD